MKQILCILFSSLVVFSLLGQQSTARSNEGTAILITATYGQQFSAGDLADRFGNNLNVGGRIEFMTKKSNLIFGLNADVLFGKDVKEDVLANLRDNDNQIIGAGAYTSLLFRERGFFAGGYFGKLIQIDKKNKRSGIRVSLGMGLLQHKIRIQDEGRNADQISGDYIKGYDRLTNGLAFTEFIGYQVMSKNRRINFYLGFEMTQGFTQNRRSFNFDTMSKDDTKRTDLLYGFRFGWSLPIYINENPDEFYY